MPDADEVLEFAREHRVSSIIFICLTLVLLEWVKAKHAPARDLAQQARMNRMFKKMQTEDMVCGLMPCHVRCQPTRRRRPIGQPHTVRIRRARPHTSCHARLHTHTH